MLPGSVHVNRTLGFAGSVALAIGALAAGALPRADPFAGWPVIRELRALSPVATAATYLGLVLLIGAWLRLRTSGASPRELVGTLAWWAAPLAVAPPLYSRDVYSYLAQGSLVRHGIDAYTYGPAALGNGLPDEVPGVWQHTPAPYGPVFLRLAAGIVGITGEHPVPAVLGLRVLAVVALVVIVRCLPPLAEACGVSPAAALWLGALNPLVLIHLVSGAHNDALMLALMLAGLVAAVRHRFSVAVLLIAAATLVKAPAVVALAALVPMRAWTLVGRWRAARAAVWTGAVAAAALAALTSALRLGHGWVGALKTPAQSRNGLSISTDLGMGLGMALGDVDAIAWTRTAFALAGAGIAVLALLRWPANPARAVGVALTAIVLCGPVVHPWYLLWGLIPLAAGAADDPRVRRLCAGLIIGLALFLMPYGGGPTPTALGAAIVGAGAGWCYLRLRPAGEVLQREAVSVDAEAADDPGGHGGHHGVVPELLPRVNV
jgi:hypothetical protein